MFEKIVSAVEKHRDLILNVERYIWKKPETGYREIKTSKYMEKAFETLGYKIIKAIPDHVVIKSYVRGLTFEAIDTANKRVNRALCGAALSLGANVDIQDVPGYAPLVNYHGMKEVAKMQQKFYLRYH